MVNETEPIAGNNSGMEGASNMAPAHPVIAAFNELQEDQDTRFVIYGLSAVVQTITLECPTAMVWNYFGENKSPSHMLGSPLDYLPNCAPSGLPMPGGPNSLPTRHRLKQAETMIKERSAAAEGKLFTLCPF